MALASLIGDWAIVWPVAGGLTWGRFVMHCLGGTHGLTMMYVCEDANVNVALACCYVTLLSSAFTVTLPPCLWLLFGAPRWMLHRWWNATGSKTGAGVAEVAWPRMCQLLADSHGAGVSVAPQVNVWQCHGIGRSS